MVGLRTILIASIVIVAAVIIIAAIPLGAYSDYTSKDSEVIATFEAFVGQNEGEKGVYYESFELRDYSAQSYFPFWLNYWSQKLDFASVELSYPLVSLVLYEVDPLTHKSIGTFPGIDKYQYFPYEVGQQWSTTINIPAEKGECIRWQIQIYLAQGVSVGYDGGYWTVR